MSEELQPSGPTATGGEQLATAPPAPVPTSPVGGDDIQWGDEAQQPSGEESKTGEANTPASAPNEIPAEAAPASEPAAPTDSPFRITALQNGEQEVTLATGQKYRGKDLNEVLGKVAAAQVEASRTISELRRAPQQQEAPKPAEPAQQSAPTAQIDPAAQVLADMTAQGLGFRDAAELKTAIAQFRETSAGFNQTIEQQRNDAAAREFVTSTPDFVATPANVAKMGDVFEEFQWEPTAKNFKAAFDILKGRGHLEAVTSEQVATPNRASNGQFLPKSAMPTPPTPAAPTPVAAPPDPWAMSDEQWSAYAASMPRH
jgi:hypothetical protein